jgi:uncharacterized protein YbaP (TraB family)
MKITALFSLFILFVSTVLGQTKVTEFPMTESSLLWKISGPEVKGDSYLFGTMHLIEKEYFLFPKKLQKQVKKSDVLVMELAGLPNQMEATGYVMLKEGSFFDYFTQDETDSILSWAKEKFGMGEETFRKSFSKMKPFAVTQLGIQLYFIGKTESYEMSFEKIAKENEITIKGLETIAQQMALFNDLSKEQQAGMVMENIRSGEEAIELIKRMQTIYHTQEIDELYQIIQSEGGVISEEQSSFLDDRNKNWVPQIKTFVKEQDAFIAVGAGHLGGPNGVIRLLEKEGYTLNPVEL